jgi:protein-glutamine gamma-glutamyltransferase
LGGSFDLRGYARQELRLAEGQQHHIVKYRVMLEPIGTNVIFTIPSPDYLFGPFREITGDRSQTFLNTDKDRPTNTYSGISDLSQPTLQDLEEARGEYPTEVQRRYLRLPEMLDPRIAELAHEITAKSRSPIEKAAAIQAYLSKFRYTLELPSQRQKDPVAYFLFERKAGHCEYFASAMAILLREEGVPSRIVTGFRGGEWNELTGNFIIRAKDAHSWVEVYFPGVGWYAFDPTPQGSMQIVTMWNRVQLYIDAAREFWREWIVNYDFVHQEHLANAAVGAGTRTFDRLKLWAHRKYESMMSSARNTHNMMVKSPRAYGGSAVLFISGIILLFNVPRLARALKMRSIARDPRKAPQSAASIWYGRMTSAMAKRGHRKSPTQTPTEFVEKIDDAKLRSGVARFTKHYENARFGNSAEDAVELAKIYEELVEKK